MVPSASTNMMLVPPAPRSPHDFQLDGGEVGDEIRLPHVVARAHGDEIAFAGIILVLAGAVGEVEVGVEDEFGAVERVHHQRQVGGRHDQRALAPASVEMPVLGVERNREQAARAPFEAALAAVAELELRAARPLEDVNDLLVEMPLRRGGGAGRNVDQEHVGEVAAALEMHRGAVDAVARPRRGCDGEEIDAVALDHRDGFALDPIEIRIDPVARLSGLAHVGLLELEFRRTATI
jgi:hypothetical protein